MILSSLLSFWKVVLRLNAMKGLSDQINFCQSRRESKVQWRGFLTSSKTTSLKAIKLKAIKLKAIKLKAIKLKTINLKAINLIENVTSHHFVTRLDRSDVKNICNVVFDKEIFDKAISLIETLDKVI